MCKSFYRALCLLILTASFISCAEKTTSKVEMLSHSWTFPASAPGNIAIPENIEDGFTLSFAAEFKESQDTVSFIDVPNVLSVLQRQNALDRWEKQNYPSYLMPDGTDPVFEAALSLNWKDDIVNVITVGIPLAILPEPYGTHQITLQFDGVKWTLYVDGVLRDNDFALGYPSSAEVSWEVNNSVVSELKMFSPALTPERSAEPASEHPLVQYWSPDYHNAWVGDVVTFFHQGRYHVFYLFDRRGHASKSGRGGHYFEHLSTADFVNWTEHEAAVPIEEQWETVGTGNAVAIDGELCLTYGLHTSRMYPVEETIGNVMQKAYEEKGYVEPVDYTSVEGLIPSGATWAVSADGVSPFHKTKILFHYCENPSLFYDPAGRLTMYANFRARGTWSADAIDREWRSDRPDFPLGGDCTFPFRWGDYEYIVGGFNGFWFRPVTMDGHEEYRDMVAEGIDVYDGLSVPCVTQLPDGRMIIAGWLKTQGWGGLLCIHELIQNPDGTLGIKWMDEVTAPSGKTIYKAKNAEAAGVSLDAGESYIIEFDVKGNGKAGIAFTSDNDASSELEWTLDIAGDKAQYDMHEAGGPASKSKTLKDGGSVSSLEDYAVNYDCDGITHVRMAVYNSPKLSGSIVDTEIGGKRTMVDYRYNFRFNGFKVVSDGSSVMNLKVSTASYSD